MEKMKVLKNDAVVHLPIGTAFYLKLKDLLVYLTEDKTDEQIKELREICKEMHEIEEATERVEVNSRFHTMIAHYSGNERVVEYLASFRERVNRDMYISSFNAVRTHDCDDEHDHIVDAIERHDEVAAETAMRQHINNAFIFKKANAEVQHKKLNEV